MITGFLGLVLLVSIPKLTQHIPIPSGLRELKQNDAVAYPAHAAIGGALNRIGATPGLAGIQWLKAAYHARSEAELDQAARGIGAAAAGRPAADQVGAELCAVRSAPDAAGAGRQVEALMRAGITCPGLTIIGAVPDDTPITYTMRPPSSGLYYMDPYPAYGVMEEPATPGKWMHNLAHGAIVLAYNCPGGCPELVARIRDLHAELPLGRNARHGVARLLATPYVDMDHRIAVIAWGQVLELDELDPEQVRAFFEAHLDRGPECIGLVCDP
jgi:hypothetical protein